MHTRLSDRLRAARQRRGLSQAELAILLRVSASAVAHWERGTSTPSLDNFRALCLYLDVPSHWLLHGEGVPPADAEAPGAMIAPAFSRDELKLVASFRQAGEDARRAMLVFADSAGLHCAAA